MPAIVRIKQYLTEAGKAGVGLMTGGLFSFTLAVIEHARGNSFSAISWGLAGGLAFMAGSFFAWLNERKKLEDYDKQRGRPEITASFTPIGDSHHMSWFLYLHNSSDNPAVDIHIEDIGYAGRVLRFMPPDSLIKGQTAPVGCGILYNGFRETNDVSSLFMSENTVPLNVPVFTLKIIFSSPDRINRKNWCFQAFFYYETQQKRMILSNQTLDVFNPATSP